MLLESHAPAQLGNQQCQCHVQNYSRLPLTIPLQIAGTLALGWYDICYYITTLVIAGVLLAVCMHITFGPRSEVLSSVAYACRTVFEGVMLSADTDTHLELQLRPMLNREITVSGHHLCFCFTCTTVCLFLNISLSSIHPSTQILA